MLTFNDEESLSFAQIKEKTGLSENELKRQLVALTMPDHLVLLTSSLQPSLQKEESKGSESKKGTIIRRAIAPSDVFEVNVGFTAKLKRIAINSL